MKLIGHAFVTGRIDFTRELNPWAFQRIDAGMKKSQRDRIFVDPTQAKFELVSAPVNEGEDPEWMSQTERILRCSESVYLQYKNGVLRFRVANLDAGKDRSFVTIGTQEEFDHFAASKWNKIRYFYAERRPGAFCFDFNTMITHRDGVELETRPMELELRLDQNHLSGRPQLVIDATGSGAPLEIIEWRGNVKEGETARYSPTKSHMVCSVRNVNRPFTLLHEDRKEFRSHSYTFNGEKMDKLLDRVIERKLKSIEADEAAELNG
ncbi:MAG: hypothetical protein AAFN77_01895 [Planctomycetota bacterium]